MDARLPIAPRPRFDHAYPTPDTAATIYDLQDLNRAVEAYRFFYPTVSMEGIFNGGRELGIEDGKQLMLLSAGPRHLAFTANSDTPYATGVLDLAEMGPVVIELPPGPYIGLLDDHHQRWIADLGIPGPDEGKGGRYLVLPPGYTGRIPHGFHLGYADTIKVLLALRAMPLGGDVSEAHEALRGVKVYPLIDPARVLPYVDVSTQSLDATPLRWEESLEYWRRLAAIIELEPPVDEFRPMYGELATLGIEKGRPFQPSPRMMRILELAARHAGDQMRVEAFASQRPDRMVWKDRRWEWVGLVPDDADFETRAFLDLEARDRWFFQAIIASPAMFRRKPGGGSIYFLAARDGSGAYLDGGRRYRLRIPQPVPAKLFWSVTAYDARTRSQVQTPQDKAVLSSLFDELEHDDDGAITVYLGPEAPAGVERRYVQTSPGTGFFLYFRIYGPEAAALDGSWRLDDLEPVAASVAEAPARNRLAAVSTPDFVATSIGELRAPLGVPTADTAARLYDHLDTTHAVDAFLNALPAVSLQAMRRALLAAGVNDGEVLLFSELMDAQSMFLTPNCDTVYFFTFLDLSRGPVVLDVPPKTLGVLDDMWSRWVADVGMAGPDRGEGGRYLIVPEAYEGLLPEGGYYVARARTSRVLVLGRAFLEKDDPAPAVARLRRGLKIYDYEPGGVGSGVAGFLDRCGAFAPIKRPPVQRFVEGTGLPMNALPPNDRSFFELLDQAVQQEAADALDPEIAGQLAAIGIVKGRAFRPDPRMAKILDDAVAIANLEARTLSFRPREAEQFGYYDAGSRWVNILFFSGFDFLRPPPFVRDGIVELFPATGARALHARTTMFYLAFGITPAMCMRVPGLGSQYLGTMCDAEGEALDGGKAYTLTLPPNIPAAAFWSVTLYDNQTRSMLKTPQRYPRAGSQAYPTPAAEPNADGSTTIAFGPRRPADLPEGNWIQTLPGQGWFCLLRLYSPLASFFDQTWRPGEITGAP